MKRTIDAAEEGTTHKRARADYVTSIVKEVRPSDVPKYLHSSDFYKALNTEGDEVFHLPANYMKQNLTVETVQDACDLLHTVRYWGSDVSLLPIVKFAMQNAHSAYKSELNEFAKEVPLIPTLLFILDTKIHCAERLIKAMELGIVELVEHLHRNGVVFSANAIATAAEFGHLDCLRYALLHQAAWEKIADPEMLYVRAVAKGQMASVKLLQRSIHNLTIKGQNKNPAWEYHLPNIAAEYGQLECLQYLHKSGSDISKSIIFAGRSSTVSCLQYLHKLGNELETTVCIEAAKHGSLACLEYFYLNGGVWHYFACHAAALNGHSECLRYLLEHGCPLTGPSVQYNVYFNEVYDQNQLVHVVAERQHWECVKYLIVYNFRTTASLATILLYNDQFELLKLALQHGCVASVDVAVYCAETGDFQCLQLAIHNGCKPSSDILIAAAAQGQLQCMKFARQAGCAWSTNVCTMAARGGHLDCLKYAREHGCPWDRSVLLVARDYGHSSVVEYATRNGCSGAPYYAASTR